jgi:general stress protein 26
MTSPTPQPTAEIDSVYSSPGATATPWARTQSVLADAAIYWLSTVRGDGRPHVTPVIAVWANGSIHFCTGPDEQKARNLTVNSNVIVTTGTNIWAGLDVVVEGRAVQITDDATLAELATAWEAKYGDEWHFDVVDGAFRHQGGTAYVFAVAPAKVYAYDRDDAGGATRYRF